MKKKAEKSKLPGESADSLKITRILCPLIPERQIPELDDYRRRFEVTWGPCSLKRKYSSQLAEQTQRSMMASRPLKYYKSLPKFYQAYTWACMVNAAKAGNMDDMPAAFITLYCQGKMNGGVGRRR
jgi:hypothetical protein